jgi:molecular chaperone DnaK
MCVLGVDGDINLGGRDFDLELANYVNEQVKQSTQKDLMNNAKQRSKLLAECERAKINFSTEQLVEIDLPSIDEDLGAIELGHDKFLDVCARLIDRCNLPVRRLLEREHVKPSDCRYLLVGGSSPLKFLAKGLTAYFHRTPETVLDPRGAIAHGACFHSASLLERHPMTPDRRELTVKEVLSHSIGVLCDGVVFDVIIPRGTEIPCKKSQNYVTTADNQTVIPVWLCEGESKLASENILISDSFIVTGIRPRPKGQAQMTVELEVDLNGILHMKAVDRQDAANQVIGVVDTAIQHW